MESSMKKPYIICHMMISIDGRIDCAMTSKLPGVDDYYTTLDEINVPTTVSGEGTEKVDYTVYIWYNVSIKYRRCFYDRTTAEIDAKSIHGNI